MALTPQQTQNLHTAIEQRRDALLAELRDDVERVRRDRFEDLAGAAPDPGDESVATLIADLDHADVGRDLSELRASKPRARALPTAATASARIAAATSASSACRPIRRRCAASRARRCTRSSTAALRLKPIRRSESNSFAYVNELA